MVETVQDGAAVAATLRRSMTALADVGRDVAQLGSAERRELLAEVDRASGVLAAVRAALVLAERETGAWRGSGDPSFAAWRGRATREGARGGAVEERRAETLATAPGLRDATVAGRVSVAHVDTVGRTAGTGSPAVKEALRSPEGQQRVLEMAQRLDAGRFSTAMAQWAAAVDADALERGHQDQRAVRFLHVTDAADGTRINGRLDRMAGHRLRLALEALSPRPALGDDRTPEQRRADALETMAEKVLALPETVPGAAQRPHVSFLMTEESWVALRATMQRRADGLPPLRGSGAPPVTLEDGTPVPSSEVARALCDCELTRTRARLRLGAHRPRPHGTHLLGRPAAGGARPRRGVRVGRLRHGAALARDSPRPLVGSRRRADLRRERSGGVQLPPPRDPPARPDGHADRARPRGDRRNAATSPVPPDRPGRQPRRWCATRRALI